MILVSGTFKAYVGCTANLNRYRVVQFAWSVVFLGQVNRSRIDLSCDIYIMMSVFANGGELCHIAVVPSVILL